MWFELGGIAPSVRDPALRLFRSVDDFLQARLRSPLPRRLVFDASTPFEVTMFRPIYGRLRADPRVAIFFTASQRPDRPIDLYRALDLPERSVLSRDHAMWMKFDVHVSAQYFKVRFVHSLVKVQIFHGVGGKAWNVSEKARQYDRLFLASDYDRRRFVEAGIFPEGDPALEVIGVPKIDCLVDGSIDRKSVLGRLDLPFDRPTVLYAPTWQTTSSLYTMGRELIAALAEGPWNLVVKLHDNCYRRDLSAGIDWGRELGTWQGRANVRVARDADVSPLLVAADLLISDLSSVALEYLLLDRPVIVADAPELFAKYAADEVSRWQREIGPLLRSAGDAVDLASRALTHPEEYCEVRRRIARTVFHDPGRATERAVASLTKLLGLEA